MPRIDVTFTAPTALPEQIKNQPPNTIHRQMVEVTGAPKSPVACVIQQQEKLRDDWIIQHGQQGASPRRMCEGKDPDAEEALNQWLYIVTGRGVRVSGPMLKSKSEDLAKKLGCNDFKAKDGWLYRWKCRFGIQFKKVHGEKDSAVAVKAEQCKSTKLTNVPQKSYADITNVDKSRLFFRATPDVSLSYKHAIPSGSKKAMGRVSVLCCVVLFKHVKN
jgi:hypothetical protein